jgi:hypothetical protein
MSAANTNFLNSQKRRIYKGAKGAYFVKRANGVKVYGLRAAFRKVGANGAEVKLTKANIKTVPSPLRWSASMRSGLNTVRAVRKNAGVKRGPLKNGTVRKAPVRARKTVAVRSPNQGLLQRKMNNEAKRLALARVKKALKPAPVRKPRARSRSNERSPNQGALQRKMNNEAKRLALARVKRALKPRAVRKPRPVARKNGAVRTIPVRRRKAPAAPRNVNQGMLQRKMNNEAKRLALARVKKALKPVAVRKPRARPVRSPNQGALLRRMNAQSKRNVLARAKRNARAKRSPMISTPGGTVYRSKRSMVSQGKRLARVKAMNDLLKAISPNPFGTLLNKPKRRAAKK